MFKTLKTFFILSSFTVPRAWWAGPGLEKCGDSWVGAEEKAVEGQCDVWVPGRTGVVEGPSGSLPASQELSWKGHLPTAAAISLTDYVCSGRDRPSFTYLSAHGDISVCCFRGRGHQQS